MKAHSGNLHLTCRMRWFQPLRRASDSPQLCIFIEWAEGEECLLPYCFPSSYCGTASSSFYLVSNPTVLLSRGSAENGCVLHTHQFHAAHICLTAWQTLLLPSWLQQCISFLLLCNKLPKCGGLKHTIYYLTVSVGRVSCFVLCLWSHKAAIKAWLGKDLPSSFRLLAAFISFHLCHWGPWLLAACWLEATLSI